VHGLVQTLRDVGFVYQDPDSGLYAVGAGLLQLGATTLDHNELRARALNWTDALAARTGQAALLGTREGGRVVVAHHVFRPDGSAQSPLTGSDRPLHAHALGKVLLAHDPHALRGLAGGEELESYTYRTITDPATLRRELADVRDHGWAADVEEGEPEVAGLAAPIRDRAGFVVAAVGVVGRVEGLCDCHHRPREALVSQVVAAGRSISRELGHGRP
jgi:DNA-binding IclR family transcriptional regulator